MTDILHRIIRYITIVTSTRIYEVIVNNSLTVPWYRTSYHQLGENYYSYIRQIDRDVQIDDERADRVPLYARGSGW